MAAVKWAPVVGLLLLLPLLPSASSSAMLLKLHGNVYPDGHYCVTMNIGEQANPYFLDIDTGSTLTWLECDAGHGSCETCNEVPHKLYQAKQSKFVPCANPMCDALHQDLGATKICKNGPQQCDYEIRYLDGSGSVGVLLTDKFAFQTANGHNTGSHFAFGCGYKQVKKGHKQKVTVDGILGLGRGSADFVSQLKRQGFITKNVISHCLSTKEGGYLIFGESDLPRSSMNWVPMAPVLPGKPNHYSPGQATLQLDAKALDAKPAQVVFDSGSTYTYLPRRLLTPLVHALVRSVRKSLRVVKDPALPLCWSRSGGFKSLDDLKKEFKSMMSLKFENGATMMLPPENYLVIIPNTGNACLGMMPGMPNSDMILIGDITLRGQLVIYDNEKGQLGWIRLPCENAKSISAIFSRI